jgi:hypothetical protein
MVILGIASAAYVALDTARPALQPIKVMQYDWPINALWESLGRWFTGSWSLKANRDKKCRGGASAYLDGRAGYDNQRERRESQRQLLQFELYDLAFTRSGIAQGMCDWYVHPVKVTRLHFFA